MTKISTSKSLKLVTVIKSSLIKVYKSTHTSEEYRVTSYLREHNIYAIMLKSRKYNSHNS